MQNDKDYQTYIDQRTTVANIVIVILAVICVGSIVLFS